MRVHIFLAGLDEDFDQIRREILRRDIAPNLDECYDLVRREAVRNTSLKEDSGALEPSAMVAHNRYTQSQQNRPNNGKTTKGIEKSSYKCDQWKKTGHTKSRCFELVGYPERWDHSRSKKNQNGSSTAAVVETKTAKDVTGQASALVLTTDNGGKFLNISTTVMSNTWIIDSGATDHMTFDSRKVLLLFVLPNNLSPLQMEF